MKTITLHCLTLLAVLTALFFASGLLFVRCTLTPNTYNLANLAGLVTLTIVPFWVALSFVMSAGYTRVTLNLGLQK